jgi:hypothetical protein
MAHLNHLAPYSKIFPIYSHVYLWLLWYVCILSPKAMTMYHVRKLPYKFELFWPCGFRQDFKRFLLNIFVFNFDSVVWPHPTLRASWVKMQYVCIHYSYEIYTKFYVCLFTCNQGIHLHAFLTNKMSSDIWFHYPSKHFFLHGL